MMKEYLKTVYDSFASIGKVKFDPASFDEDIAAKLTKFDRAIRLRDARESFAALVLFIIFFIKLIMANQSRLGQVGDSIMLFSCVFIAYVLHRFKSFSSNVYSLPIMEYVEHQRVFLVNQKKLLNNILWWYLLPPSIGLILPELENEWSWRLVTFIVLLVAMMGVIYYLNLKAAKSLQPFIEEIDDFLKDAKEAD
jgi:hypothetical protein